MSQSWRITTQESAAPFALARPSQTTGAMVLRAKKGNAKPIRFERGDSAGILNYAGYPSAMYPDVQEALDYISDSALWLSCPSDPTEALYGGALVTKTGSVPLSVGVADLDTFDFAEVSIKEEVAEGTGTDLNFVKVLDGDYSNNSLSQIIVGDTTIDVTVTDAEPEVITGAGITAGTLTRATGSLDITFDVEPDSGDKIYAVYTTDYSNDAYYLLTSASPHISDEQIKVSYDTFNEVFKINYFIKNHRGVANLVEDYEGSLDPEKFDANGNNVFIENAFEDDRFLNITLNPSLPTYDTFTDDASNVNFVGGKRATTFSATDYAEGWEFFKQARKYDTRIFMDVTKDPAIPAIFDTLRKSFQPYRRYLIPLPDLEDWDDSTTTKQGYSIDNRGLCFYANHLQRRENFTRTKFWSPLIGEVGKAHAKIIRGAFGGLAPSWLNENGLGGQLTPSNALEMRYDYSEDQLRSLDGAGINPIVFHPEYGVIITSQKTGQNPLVLTDFSFIAHSGTADYIIENVINQALPQQITKLNDSTHRAIVKGKADAIVSPLENVNGNVIVSEFVNKCDAENNNAEVLARRDFILTTAVKFTPTSETITYNFRSAEQGTSVEEIVG